MSNPCRVASCADAGAETGAGAGVEPASSAAGYRQAESAGESGSPSAQSVWYSDRETGGREVSHQTGEGPLRSQEDT